MDILNVYCILLYLIVSVILVNGHVVNNIKSDNGPVVETPVGAIRGVRVENGNYSMFLGIPYAKVNESNPFGHAIPYPPFESIYEANDDTVICPQLEEFNYTIVGSLDCLNLHIHVPDTANSQTNLPVMVYIYGGRFVIGFAGRFLFGPEYLIRHDVILVTLNYRVGVYGFMCLDTPEVPGNQGLKDQILALRWIKNNIQSFGGDPNKITVFGNSAGGMSIGLHLISDTEQLFHNAIQQSGSAFMGTVIKRSEPSYPIKLAEKLGHITDNINEALDYLTKTEVHKVIEAGAALGIIPGPCVEKEFTGVERYLSRTAINSNHSKHADITVMLGYNTHESLLGFVYSEDPQTFDRWGQTFEASLRNNFNFPDNQLSELALLVRRFYIGDEIVDNTIRHNLIDFASDITFVYPAIRSIRYFFEGGSKKIYQYVFSYDGERNFLKVRHNVTEPGAIHADEYAYLFKMEFFPQEPNAEDQLVIDRMTLMWTNFAKYSDPTPTVTNLLPVKWEAITKDSAYHYINIDKTLTAGRRYESRRMTFWDLFYETYKKYEVGYSTEDDEDPDVPGSANMKHITPILIILVFVNLFV